MTIKERLRFTVAKNALRFTVAKNALRFTVAKNALRLAMWLEPNIVRNAMAGVFIDQMRREGVVAIEFGFDDEGDPAMLVRKMSDLPIVTRH